MKQTVRIGCGSGFWGDSAEGPRQLVNAGGIDYLILDYLAEITMSLLARARAKKPEAGYATDFPAVIAGLAPKIKAQGIKVVANAGGVNAAACKAALDALLQAQGVDLKVSIVTGDDLLPRAAEFAGVKEMFSGTAMPPELWSMNAYLGGFPIARALEQGADIVITGRCVDSALALGPLIHEFGWQANDFDRLSAGSLAGHLLECGVQVTGGISTDWALVADGWHNMGFPIAHCHADGTLELTKPEGTGGRVSPETLSEQIVYEIGDASAYLLPDVTCDWRQLKLEQVGENRVHVSGARGRAPTDHYKVSATYQDGFRATGTMMIGGIDAVKKAEAVAAAILKRTRALFAERGLADYLRTDVEVLGSESNWGAHARRRDTREVVLKISVHHSDKRALELFGRECIPPATAMAQGITGFSGGRPAPTPLVRLFSCLIPKSAVQIEVDGAAYALPAVNYGDAKGLPDAPVDETPISGPTRKVRLIDIAYGRSGDKGDASNIGILARDPKFVPVLRAQLTAEVVKAYFAHFAQGPVTRYEIPGLHGFNFFLADALGGGGIASLRYDPQGKMMAQILLDIELDVPTALLD